MYPTPCRVAIKSTSPTPASFRRRRFTFTVSVFSSTKLSVSHSRCISFSRLTTFPALTYLRLEEGGSDYVIRTCAVDDVVRAAVRRFAGEFIDRRIALDYTPVEWETVTDGKWLTFVVEQLLSNALKYTGQDGTVRIYREGDDLCIRDSGMGIAPEDLPRVFDMGYTGQNGRLDRRSSGIGLYLCRRICRNLRHEIRIESVPGAGTTVYLTLGRGDFLPGSVGCGAAVAGNKVLGTFQHNPHPLEFRHSKVLLAAGGQNPQCTFGPDTRNTQQGRLGRSVDLHGEKFRVAHCPGTFGVQIRVEVGVVPI